MNQLQTSLKQARNANEAWRLIADFLSRISDISNRHMMWTFDGSGKQNAIHSYGDSQNDQKSSPTKNNGTHYVWLFFDLLQTAPLNNNSTGRLTPIGNILLSALNHIMTLKQQERALQAGITARERETLSLLAKGLRNDTIAYRMGIKRVTVSLHISNARRKLDSTTREQAVARAVHMGIIKP
mgnify:CR=1 FL=1